MMTHVTSILLLSAALAFGSVGSVSVTIQNSAITDLTIEQADNRFTYIAPGESANVEVRENQLIIFGQIANRYSFLPLTTLHNGNIGLLAKNDGCLYLQILSADKLARVDNKQPEGFPLCPVEILDNT